MEDEFSCSFQSTLTGNLGYFAHNVRVQVCPRGTLRSYFVTTVPIVGCGKLQGKVGKEKGGNVPGIHQSNE